MERAAVQWKASWLKRHPYCDEDAAQSKWDSLTIEMRSHLMNISEMEIRIIEEIRVKLLKTLDDHPAPETLKKAFRDQLTR